MNIEIEDILVKGQTDAFNAHTEQIIDLIYDNHVNYDNVIKRLIDERRWVYNEFAKRIEDQK